MMRIAVASLTLWACLLGAMGLSQAADNDGWITMFNGKDLTGWKANPENPDSFKVEDGLLIIDGPRCHLFWVGDPDDPNDERFTSFHWHAKVKTMPKANSGLYFHTKYQELGWPEAGYECQVNQTHKDRKKTGGLYAIADVLDQSPVKDGEWYDYDIIVDGKHIVLKINGEVTTDWTEPAGWQPPKNMPGRKLSEGTFAIQAHDPDSVVHYKDLRVKRLPELFAEKALHGPSQQIQANDGLIERSGKFQGFSGLPVAAACGGRPLSQPARRCLKRRSLARRRMLGFQKKPEGCGQPGSCHGAR